MKIYPKLNIFLNVLPVNNGMHPIFSRFVLAKGELYDEMEVRFGTKDGFEILGDFGFGIQENLIYKAKEALSLAFPSLQEELNHCIVEVKKNIPQGSGLGGGSANAGAFLSYTRDYFSLPQETISQIATQLGSDVSFFVSGYESANVSGFGEIVEEYEESNHYCYEIFTPHFGCETKKVYQAFDSLSSWQLKIDFLNLSSMELLYRYDLKELNDLFLPASQIYPSLLKVLEELGEGWFFSGSGSSFFRIKQ